MSHKKQHKHKRKAKSQKKRTRMIAHGLASLSRGQDAMDDFIDQAKKKLPPHARVMVDQMLAKRDKLFGGKNAH